MHVDAYDWQFQVGIVKGQARSNNRATPQSELDSQSKASGNLAGSTEVRLHFVTDRQTDMTYLLRTLDKLGDCTTRRGCALDPVELVGT